MRTIYCRGTGSSIIQKREQAEKDGVDHAAHKVCEGLNTSGLAETSSEGGRKKTVEERRKNRGKIRMK